MGYTPERINEILKKYKKTAEEKHQIVTVFITASNREYYLSLAMKAVLAQTYTNFCLVVLDNESTDGTEKMVTEWPDDRIFFISRKSVEGNKNFRFAVNNCCTKYCVVLHDDDEVEPEYLQTVVDEMEAHDYDLASVRCIRIDGDGNEINKEKTAGKDLVWKDDGYFKQYFNRHSDGITFAAAIYRQSFIDKNIDYLNDVFVKESGIPAGDENLFFEIGRLGGTECIIDKHLIRYRIHGQYDSQVSSGFLMLQLIDYLLKDDYYAQRFEPKKAVLADMITDCYFTIMRNYYRHLIDKKRFKSMFDYDCMKYIRTCSAGKKAYAKMRFRYLCIDSHYFFPKYKV